MQLKLDLYLQYSFGSNLPCLLGKLEIELQLLFLNMLYLLKKSYKNPFIIQRADPFITKGDGYFYFTASFPAFRDAEHGYDRIILRRSKTVNGLAEAEEKTIWQARETGIMARHIWAPELHYLDGKWYIYFAAGEQDDMWKIRPFVLECQSDDPMAGPWVEKGKMQRSDDDIKIFNGFESSCILMKEHLVKKNTL